MSVTVTEKAIKELKRVREDQKLPDDTFVRIAVTGGGCSGFQYNLDFDEANKFDEKTDEICQEIDGVKIVVDKKSSLYLEGTVLDFYEDLAKRGFTFENPNATKGCGCGNSFSV